MLARRHLKQTGTSQCSAPRAPGAWGCRTGSWARSAPLVECRAVAAVPADTTADTTGPQGPPAGGEKIRRIVFLRHAESESKANCKDHDRPLSASGRAAAIEAARALKARGWIPDLVLASNAKRTKETLDCMSTVISALGQIDSHFYGSLYTVAALDGQTAHHLQDCLLEVVDDARHQCVLLVGHNKGWEEAASHFAGCAIRLRTASAALLQAASESWTECLKDDVQWQLIDVVTPAHST